MDGPMSDISESRELEFGGSILQGASNVNIVGGTFNAYGTGGANDKQRMTNELAVLNEKRRITEAMALLESRAEKGAPYDAAAREDVPKCHEHTRVAIIDGVHNWAHSEYPDGPPLMWIYGPAGSGKTTIVQTVAETFDKEKTLAASFFFSRSSPARPKNKDNFVITLAHQLSLHIPALQRPMADALASPSLLSKSLVKQLDTLIIDPLKQLDPAELGARFIFLVDGLDECDGDAAQRDTLSLLERLLRQTRPRLHIRILVACRFLSHIEAFFSQRSISAITQTTPLDNDYQCDADINEYFRVEFERILSEHPSRIGLPSNWPPASDIEILVRRASGQFIYSAVVVKFIASHDRHPGQSLRTIIGLPTTIAARPYQDLDAVYHHVLSTVEPENLEFVQTLIGCLLLDPGELVAQEILKWGKIQDVDSFFMLEPGETVARMNRMSPLIGPSYSQFSHASFAEYLQDYSRSKEFFLDKCKAHCLLARHWFHSFSMHFTCHPGEGIIPTGLQDYYGHVIHPDTFLDLQNGRIFHDVIYHCIAAEWTSELRQDVLQFNVLAAFRDRNLDEALNSPENILIWEGILRWSNFILSVEERRLLSQAETEHILHVLEDMIRSTFLETPIPDTVLKPFVALLTIRRRLIIDQCVAWCKNEDDWKLLSNLVDCQKFVSDEYLPWFCKAIGVDLEISTDRDAYTDLALLYIQHRFEPDWSFTGDWPFHIAPMLAQASRSEGLAALLTKHFVQVRRSVKPSIYEADSDFLTEHFMAIFIYLFECGVPILIEHQHGPEFNHINWICGICHLFDPLKADCADIELSGEPTPQPPSFLHAQIAQGEVAAPPGLEVNGPRRLILGVQLLWLQAWIAWFTDTVMRFFPVVA